MIHMNVCLCQSLLILIRGNHGNMERRIRHGLSLMNSKVNLDPSSNALTSREKFVHIRIVR
jgi:hypothetical protein